MALLTRQNASGLDGATVTFATATATTGDTIAGGQGVHLLVNNANAGVVTVVITTPETVEGTLAVADRSITVTNATIREIPVPSRYNDPTTGLATVVCTPAASVTVAAVQGSVTP